MVSNTGGQVILANSMDAANIVKNCNTLPLNVFTTQPNVQTKQVLQSGVVSEWGGEANINTTLSNTNTVSGLAQQIDVQGTGLGGISNSTITTTTDNGSTDLDTHIAPRSSVTGDPDLVYSPNDQCDGSEIIESLYPIFA